MRFFQQLSVLNLLFRIICSQVPLIEKQHHDLRTLDILIFEHCQKDYKTIIVDDSSKRLDLYWIQQLHEQFYSIILFKRKVYHHQARQHVKKIDAIVITTPTSEKLVTILESLRKTTWWNVMIPVYLVNLPMNNCKIARKILKRMWDCQILASYSLCIESNGIIVYTYNPFTNRAPSNWIKLKNAATEPKWALYRRKNETGIICHELYFDRTKHLDGYHITIATPSHTKESQSFTKTFLDYEKLHLFKKIVTNRTRFLIDAFVMILNVTVRLYFSDNPRNATQYIGFLERQNRIVYHNSSANFILLNQPLHHATRNLSRRSLFQLTYPLLWSEYGIASYNRGYQTFAEKTWNFYGIWTVLFTIFVLIATFTVIWFTESRNTSFTIFEIIRLLISQGLYTRMNTLPLRIFFISILIYSLIVQATLNGQLAKFLTIPELRRHPETKEDLIELGYTKVYDSKSLTTTLAKSRLEKITGYAKTKLCLNYIEYNDTSAVCILDYEFLSMYTKGNKNLYLSRPFGTYYKVYSTYKYWPLANRVNLILMMIPEFGFPELKPVYYSKNDPSTIGATARAVSSDDFHPIKLENLTFSFSLLALGLISAMISFFVEVYIG